ncbi:regulator of chromosome condensation 1/beta-lactamase-inhibitor protein II [Baffinella frigidus]|nr:regulator of chromosome condensation 1/beta-lactamase-inhibitor protein II [Cryptophyta sp. CCMP2293]
MAASNVTTSELSVFAQAVAWGCAKHCQLGAGEGQHALEDRVALAPMRVAGLEGHDLVSIYSGFRHTAFVTSKGKVLLSGVSLHGRLGHDQGDLLIPHSVKNLEGVRIHSVAAGQRHTVLLAVSGCVYTFGDGSQGQLGHGDNIGCSLPRLVATIRPGKHVEAMTGKVSHMMQVKAVAAGGYHSLVISTDDGLMTWGRGGEGQLGTDSRFR